MISDELIEQECVDVYGFEGLYKISKSGEIISLPKKIDRKGNPRWGGDSEYSFFTKKRKLKPTIQECNNGKYHRYRVTLRKDGESYYKFVHHLVLCSFDRPPKEGEVCRHIDGNSLNNHISNLAWGTCLENTHDSIIHGTKTNPPINFGESHHNSKLKKSEVKFLQSIKPRRGDAIFYAEKFNVHPATIRRVFKSEARING
jgi:hypothetical protein